MNYTCIVCGYPELTEKFLIGTNFSSTHEICPSCGFHYGYHDLNADGSYPLDFSERDIVREYRKSWINGGMQWKHNDEFSLMMKPQNWDPHKQLENIPEEFR